MSCSEQDKGSCFWFTRSLLLIISVALIPVILILLPFLTALHMGFSCYSSCAKPICKGNVLIAILCSLICAIPLFALVIGLASTFGSVIGVIVCLIMTTPALILFWYHFFSLAVWKNKRLVV